MVDVSALGGIAEKPVSQNSINYDDTVLNYNLLDIINVSGELEVIVKEMNRIQMLFLLCSSRKIKQTNWFTDFWKYE